MSSFENMKAYSLIFDSFQNKDLDDMDQENVVKVRSARHINFFLKIFQNSLSYLSRTSSDSMVTSLNLILSSARISNLFSSSPKYYEYQIIDKLYVWALESYSKDIIDVIFNELEYIAIKLIGCTQKLDAFVNTILRNKTNLIHKDIKYYISVSLVNLCAKILEHFVKENYNDFTGKRNEKNIMHISSHLKDLIIPVVESIYGVISEEKDPEMLQELKNSLTKPIRNLWGYALIYNGLSDKIIPFENMFNPYNSYSKELMNLAYFITPPLIIPSKGVSQNALLDPEFSPEIIELLSNSLIGYFSKKYKRQKSAFSRLPEDMIILLGEIEIVMANQLLYLYNHNYNSDEFLVLPNFIQDIFYYLTHDDITSLKDMVDIISEQANSYLDYYFDIILTHKNSSFAKDTVSRDICIFIENICDDCPHVISMINKYPYMFLWKPVLNSFISVIDQLAHLKYLEYGKIPDVNYTLRKVMKSDKPKDVFAEMITKSRRLTLFALISNHSHFQFLLESIELENRSKRTTSSSISENIHNFTINLIKKWISEFSPTTDQYELKSNLILLTGEQPMKMSEKKIDQFFIEDVRSKKFLGDPLTIMSFDNTSTANYTKSIHYFLELAENMLRFEEEKSKTGNDLDNLKPKSLISSGQSQGIAEISKTNIDALIYEVLERVRISLTFQNEENAYGNFMTLQCLYLIIKNNPRYANVANSTIRELANSIVIIASISGSSSCLKGYSQFIEYLQSCDKVDEIKFFTNQFFGSEAWYSKFSKCFRQSDRSACDVPAIVRIFNDFNARYGKQRLAHFKVNKQSQENILERDKTQFVEPKRLQKLVSSIEKIKVLDNHEYVAYREQSINSVDLNEYFEIYIG